MKKIILILQVILTSTTLLAQKFDNIDDPIYNQTDSPTIKISFELGGGLGTKAGIDDDYSSKIGFGINPRINLYINDNLSLVPGFIYFFPKSSSNLSDIDVISWQLNLNANYQFSKETPFYIIAGLNYSYAAAEFMGFMGEYDEIGAELGFGIKTNDLIPFFGELKYDTAFDQILLLVGISIPFY
jgi:hypothetical protein